MGANVLVRAAGLQGKDFPLKAIASVNNPFDVWLAINLMRGNPYEKYLARELRDSLILRENHNMTAEEKQKLADMIQHFKLDLDTI